MCYPVGGPISRQKQVACVGKGGVGDNGKHGVINNLNPSEVASNGSFPRVDYVTTVSAFTASLDTCVTIYVTLSVTAVATFTAVHHFLQI